MRLSKTVQSAWRYVILALLVGAFSLAGAGATAAHATTHPRSSASPLAGCAPCISSLVPAQDGTVQADASGNVTLSFGADMSADFTQFVLTIDGTAVDSTKIQVTSTAPLEPTGQYKAKLTAGAHSAAVEADDAGGAEATFAPWNFTVQGSAATTPTPTKTPAGGTGATKTPTTGSTGTTGTASTPGGGSSLISPKTLSIILFAIAGLGLLVMSFIAGVWYGGRNELRNET
jgi:hypothetical protein